MHRSKRITIEDVADRVGVHAGTVSRALNRPERVAPETRIRVEAAVEELGFVPNRAARGLITGRTGNIAVVVPDITNPHFAALIRSTERAARAADLQSLLVDTGEHPDEEVRAARTLNREVDGFVVLSSRRLYRELDALEGTPAVFVNRPVAGQPSVLMRTAPAAEAAMRHLVELGHREAAHLAGPKASWAAGERRKALHRMSRAAGVVLHDVAAEAPTFEAAVDSVDALLASGATAITAFNDQMALGVIAGLAHRGVRVPEDISVIGCDDVPMAAMVSPALTTIRMPVEEAGSVAVEVLQAGAGQVELVGTFVVRGSSGTANDAPRRARPRR